MEFLTNTNFEEKVSATDKPVIVKFLTPSCPNCKRLAPTYDATAADNASKATFFKLNAEDYLSVAKKFKVMAVPALLFFRHGILVKKKSGAISQAEMERIIEAIAPYSKEEAETNEYKPFLKRLFKR